MGPPCLKAALSPFPMKTQLRVKLLNFPRLQNLEDCWYLSLHKICFLSRFRGTKDPLTPAFLPAQQVHLLSTCTITSG